MSFGNELKSAREAQALSIQDVATRIKIRGDYLRALEAEDLGVLPERTFARSYLQSYGRALGLDPAGLLRDFDRLLPQPAEQVNHLRRPAASPRRRGRNTTGLVGGLLGGVLLLAVAGYFGYTAYQARSIVSASDQESQVALPSTRQVSFSLTSTPPGARVYLDNRYLGLTPVQNFPLDARAQGALRVEYGGRQTYQASLNLQADRRLSVTLPTLTAAQLAAQAAAAKAAAARAAGTAASTGSAGTPAPTAASSTPSKQAVPTPAATPTPPKAAPSSGVRLSWTGASWTRVTSASGQVLYQGIPAAGSSRDFPSGVLVRTGSAGLVTATVSGGQPQKLGAVGQVVTRTF